MSIYRDSDSLKKMLIVSIYISALSFFALQVKDVCIKYFEKKTTVAISGKIHEEIQVPIVTICSGYKITSNVSREALAFHDIETPSLFDKSTYKLGRDFYMETELMLESPVIKVYIKEGHNTLSFPDNPDSKPVTVIVKEITSLRKGRCYEIEIKRALKDETDFVDISLYYSKDLDYQDTEVGFKAIVSNKSAKAGAIYEVWHGWKSIFIDMPKGVRSKIGLTLTSNIHLEETGQCQEYEFNESRSQCQLDKLTAAGVSKILESCPQQCFPPVGKSALEESNSNMTSWNYCQTLNDALCTTKAILAVSLDSTVVRACPQPCTEVEFKGNIKTDAVPYSAGLYLYLDSMAEEVFEQVLLFDIPSFIGNIGGSLGLFIGFSYLDFATKLTESLLDFLYRKK